ncbi:Uncharacterized protein OBRU01_01027, partial [Operophtera brumata]
ALISSRKVITSASCLTDVSHVYVIAGYKKYVNGRGIAYDPCTSKRKNRVVMTCVPKDKSWRDHCSYIPKPIRISYSAEFTRADTDVVTFGWGGSYWRPNTDVTDNNSPYLQEISSMVIGKQICMDKYEDPVKTHIGQYMLCVEGNHLPIRVLFPHKLIAYVQARPLHAVASDALCRNEEEEKLSWQKLALNRIVVSQNILDLMENKTL